jgi:L-threonylcarbamoyladenylate synthase
VPINTIFNKISCSCFSNYPPPDICGNIVAFMQSAQNPELRQAAEALKNGQAIGLPTETVYGLAADATNAEAVARIFQIKGRPFFDPLIVHLASLDEVPLYAAEWPTLAQKLAEKFWPGPLTLIVPKRPCIPDLVTSGLPHVALRVPAHPLALALLREFGGPLAAPSANRFGRISPTTAAAVREELGAAVPLVLDGGPCAIGLESTIVSLANGCATILRPGGLSREAIESVIGSVKFADKISVPPGAPLTAPGTLAQHYAPRTPLRLVTESESIDLAQRESCGLLSWGEVDGRGFAMVRNLSPQRSFTAAAANLFRYLRELDHADLREIIAAKLPEQDLGLAINDRLQRAAH